MTKQTELWTPTGPAPGYYLITTSARGTDLDAEEIRDTIAQMFADDERVNNVQIRKDEVAGFGGEVGE